MRITRQFVGLMAIVFAGACGTATERGTEPPATEPGRDVQERAQQILAPLKQRLAGELTKALAAGPTQAIEVCAVSAQEITAELTAAGVRLGRTSHRVRNPRNEPEPWMEPLLAGFLSNPQDRVPHTVRIDEDTMGYVEPIQVQAMCLTCHGETLAPELKRKIEERYPEDEATGFAAGDFRGMFWVTLPVRDDAG